MSEPTFIGTVTVHGIDGTLAYTGLATAKNLLRKVSYKDTIQKKQTKDSKAKTVGVKGWDPSPEISISFAPCEPAGSGSIAAAKTRVVIPAFGSKVTLAGFPPDAATAEGVSFNSAKWLYLGGGSIEVGDEDDIMINLDLTKFTDDIAATPNT